MEPELHRLRVAYRKSDRLAYLGHLEVLHTLERCVRRAGLPFGVSPGFARRMRIQYSQALPVGAASTCEYLDVGLTVAVDAHEALQSLMHATPPQLAPYAVGYVATAAPALEAWLTRAAWKVEIATTASPSSVDAALVGVLAAGSISFMRGSKPRTVDVSATLVGWEAHESSTGGVSLTLETRSSNAGALRPAVLLDAAFARGELAADTCGRIRVTRVAQCHETRDGTLIEPFGVCLPPGVVYLQK